MPCGCQSARDEKKNYIYVSEKGTQHTFRTEIEAMAAKVRAGGGGKIEARAA